MEESHSDDTGAAARTGYRERYLIASSDPTLSDAAVQDRIDRVAFFASEFMELHGLAHNDPIQTRDALLDALQSSSPYFQARTDSGEVVRRKICYELREALLHQLERSLSVASDKDGLRSALLSLKARTADQLAVGLYVAGPLTDRPGGLVKPPEEQSEQIQAWLHNEDLKIAELKARPKLLPGYPKLLMDAAGQWVTITDPEHEKSLGPLYPTLMFSRTGDGRDVRTRQEERDLTAEGWSREYRAPARASDGQTTRNDSNGGPPSVLEVVGLGGKPSDFAVGRTEDEGAITVEIRAAGGLASAFKAGDMGLVKQVEFPSSTLPDGPDEFKHEGGTLAHAAITAVTLNDSVPQSRPEDWVVHMKKRGRTFETAEEFLIASESHLRALALDELSVGKVEKAERLTAIEKRFADLRSRCLRTSEARTVDAVAVPSSEQQGKKVDSGTEDSRPDPAAAGGDAVSAPATDEQQVQKPDAADPTGGARPDPDGAEGDAVSAAEPRSASKESDMEEGIPADAGDRELPRRTPDLETSRKRIELFETLARELAIVKEETRRGYCAPATLKGRFPNFTLWRLLEDSRLKELADGEPFSPRAYASNLTLAKYGLTSRETLKKDRRKLRKAEKAQERGPSR